VLSVHHENVNVSPSGRVPMKRFWYRAMTYLSIPVRMYKTKHNRTDERMTSLGAV
jgi:hypothetical protein